MKKKNIGILSTILISAGILSMGITETSHGQTKIMAPFKQVSKLECRFTEFGQLSNDCKMDFPLITTADYQKYAKLNNGYNDYTRLYTVLYSGSYKYGWDVGNGGHPGIDVATAKGTPVYAIADGEVVSAGHLIGWGYNVTIKHNINGKNVYSNYAHLSKVDTTKGTKISIGTKIGEVGSTGNSTGNHLHFQIDLETKFHPYWFDPVACPYPYSKVSESTLCTAEMKKYTLDPIEFINSAGELVNNVKIVETPKTETPKNSNGTSSQVVATGNSIYPPILEKNLYVGAATQDVKDLQLLLSSMGVYRGEINGNYNDLMGVLMDLQIQNNIISSATEAGAGHFGPKTREFIKGEYKKMLDAGGLKAGEEKTYVVDTPNVVVSQEGLMTREEIEAREIEDFIRINSIDFKAPGGNVNVGKNVNYSLEVNSLTGKVYKGNTPVGIVFEYDKNVISVFPESLYYFQNGQRDITVTGVKSGKTNLKVKLGNKIIKEVTVNVIDNGNKEDLTIASTYIFASNKATIGEQKGGIAVFRNKNGANLVGKSFSDKFTLKAESGNISFCIKRGAISNAKAIYNRKCSDSEFVNSATISYNDTVGGFLMFEYKVNSSNSRMTLTKNGQESIKSAVTVNVQSPVGLTSNYAYYDEIMKGLELGILGGINQGHFLEARGLVRGDAYAWIDNYLSMLEKNNSDSKMAKLIESRRSEIKYAEIRRTDVITRGEFLDLVSKYLVFENSSSGNISFSDLTAEQNSKARIIFDQNNTWQENSGATHYRPEKNITRGEAAFMLARTLEKNKTTFVALR